MPAETENLPSPSFREVYRLTVLPALVVTCHNTEDQPLIIDRLAPHICMGLDTIGTASPELTVDLLTLEEPNTTCHQLPTEDTKTKNRRRLPKKHGEHNSTSFCSLKETATKRRHVLAQRRLSNSGTSSTATRMASSRVTHSTDFCKTRHNSTFLTPRSTLSTRPSELERKWAESQTPNSSRLSAGSSQELKAKNRMVQTNKRRAKIIMKRISNRKMGNNNKWTQKLQ